MQEKRSLHLVAKTAVCHSFLGSTSYHLSTTINFSCNLDMDHAFPQLDAVQLKGDLCFLYFFGTNLKLHDPHDSHSNFANDMSEFVPAHPGLIDQAFFFLAYWNKIRPFTLYTLDFTILSGTVKMISYNKPVSLTISTTIQSFMKPPQTSKGPHDFTTLLMFPFFSRNNNTFFQLPTPPQKKQIICFMFFPVLICLILSSTIKCSSLTLQGCVDDILGWGCNIYGFSIICSY